jgi:hypothetical protein
VTTKKSFPTDKCIYLISLDDAAYTTATLQETHRHHTPFPYGESSVLRSIVACGRNGESWRP